MWTKLFLVTVLVAVCAARCKDKIPAGVNVGSVPCGINPGTGTYGLGGAAGGFPGINGENIDDSDNGNKKPLFGLFGSKNPDDESGSGITSIKG